MEESAHRRNLLRFDYAPVDFGHPEEVESVSTQKAGLTAREANRSAGWSNFSPILTLAGCG